MILTSDAATILRELDVVHPAAKLIVMASQQQEAEVSFLTPEGGGIGTDGDDRRWAMLQTW
jgi:hypothetical protein